jgi:hypothetical protein
MRPAGCFRQLLSSGHNSRQGASERLLTTLGAYCWPGFIPPDQSEAVSLHLFAVEQMTLRGVQQSQNRPQSVEKREKRPVSLRLIAKN